MQTSELQRRMKYVFYHKSIIHLYSSGVYNPLPPRRKYAMQYRTLIPHVNLTLFFLFGCRRIGQISGGNIGQIRNIIDVEELIFQLLLLKGQNKAKKYVSI